MTATGRGVLDHGSSHLTGRRCPGAIVGRGSGRAIVKFPEQPPIPISSPITIFNGPKAKIPEIAGGAGHPTAGWLRIGRKWIHEGKRRSYVNARCEAGHLQARAEVTFKGGTFLVGTFVRSCRVRAR